MDGEMDSSGQSTCDTDITEILATGVRLRIATGGVCPRTRWYDLCMQETPWSQANPLPSPRIRSQNPIMLNMEEELANAKMAWLQQRALHRLSFKEEISEADYLRLAETDEDYLEVSRTMGRLAGAITHLQERCVRDGEDLHSAEILNLAQEHWVHMVQRLSDSQDAIDLFARGPQSEAVRSRFAELAWSQKAIVSDLSSCGREVLRDYEGPAWRPINALLRGGVAPAAGQDLGWYFEGSPAVSLEEAVRERISVLDRLFDEVPALSQPILVTRQVRFEDRHYLERARHPINLREQYVEGVEITEAAYMSTNISLGSLGASNTDRTEGSVRLLIEVPAGITVLSMAGLLRMSEDSDPSEHTHEVVLPRGTRMQVISADFNDDEDVFVHVRVVL